MELSTVIYLCIHWCSLRGVELESHLILLESVLLVAEHFALLPCLTIYLGSLPALELGLLGRLCDVYRTIQVLHTKWSVWAVIPI